MAIPLVADPTYVKALFPEFSAVSDVRMQALIDIANLSVNQKVWGSSYAPGIAYLVAHLLKRSGTATGVSGGSSQAGTVSSEKVGELQRSYAAPNLSGSSGEDALLSTTSYGIEYLRLRRQILITPMVT